MDNSTQATPTSEAAGHEHPKSFWLWVMCLTGVDYFSTLGYQPSIAFEATGLLTPFATIILVLVTLLGALPVYCYVAGKSPNGQGSIAMLERLLHGWGGKLLVLVLLGFAATDFVITKTLSAADAAAHVIKNPMLEEYFKGGRWQIGITFFLLLMLGATFMRGFKEVIGMAVGIVGVYLLLNVIVVGSSLYYVWQNPIFVERWLEQVGAGNWHFEHHFSTAANPWHIGLICVVLFPKLALGLSGFETGVAVMPLIQGDATDTEANPAGRIRNACKLLFSAAIIMSLFLLGASLVTSTLIAPEALMKKTEANPNGGGAHDRALAYLAHGEPILSKEPVTTIQPFFGAALGMTHDVSTVIRQERGSVINPLFGSVFGTIYDVSTVVILWFAGASAMAGLLNLVPKYLPRYGMAPNWASAMRPLVILFTIVNLFVTWYFDASVEKQGAAYATGVLVLMSSACVASLIDRWRARSGFWLVRMPWIFAAITLVFLYTTLANMIEKPDGLFIAIWFIVATVVSSIVSRYLRSKELRFQGLDFMDAQSRFLWDSMRMLEFPVLVPHRPGGRSLREKEASIRKEHRLGPEIPVVFIEANLGDVSDFYQTPLMEVKQEEGVFILHIHRCASIAHTIAALALELSKVGSPPEIHFGWSDQNTLEANVGFLLFGEGNVPWLVRELLCDAQPNPELRPRVIIG